VVGGEAPGPGTRRPLSLPLPSSQPRSWLLESVNLHSSFSCTVAEGVARQRLRAAKEAAWACNAALQQLSKTDGSLSQVVMHTLPSSSSSSHSPSHGGGSEPLIAVLAEALACESVDAGTKTALACVVATLLSEERVAAQVLLSSPREGRFERPSS
jgi:hypothetical protein